MNYFWPLRLVLGLSWGWNTRVYGVIYKGWNPTQLMLWDFFHKSWNKDQKKTTRYFMVQVPGCFFFMALKWGAHPITTETDPVLGSHPPRRGFCSFLRWNVGFVSPVRLFGRCETVYNFQKDDCMPGRPWEGLFLVDVWAGSKHLGIRS